MPSCGFPALIDLYLILSTSRVLTLTDVLSSTSERILAMINPTKMIPPTDMGKYRLRPVWVSGEKSPKPIKIPAFNPSIDSTGCKDVGKEQNHSPCRLGVCGQRVVGGQGDLRGRDGRQRNVNESRNVPPDDRDRRGDVEP
ncbi:hypothetical protein KC365_g8 [Hortaea werneckii]|nr:hypothetical protein KC339_g8 [Hortaea werneckii]KAI7245841.1 hypothetical protein KC365_g8 [Hortaea werneckii]